MEIISKFKADDGTVFDTKQECESYEIGIETFLTIMLDFEDDIKRIADVHKDVMGTHLGVLLSKAEEMYNYIKSIHRKN